MGSALRHAQSHLATEHAERRLLLVLTDGEPHDVDVADPEYLALDARAAVRAGERRGIVTFCLSLERRADACASRIFGEHRYAVVDRLERLPQTLPRIYRALTAR
jgi:nitric oxide reductase NorD protein